MITPDIIESLLPTGSTEEQRNEIVGKFFTEMELEIVKFLENVSDPNEAELSFIEKYTETDERSESLDKDLSAFDQLLLLAEISPRFANYYSQKENELFIKYVKANVASLSVTEQEDLVELLSKQEIDSLVEDILKNSIGMPPELLKIMSRMLAEFIANNHSAHTDKPAQV